MIIVEGPDGAGKTTLVSRIELDWGIVREKRAVSSAAEALTPIGEYIEAELNKGFGMRLYDRFALISSPMYMMLPNRTFVEPMTDYTWLQGQYVKFRKVNPVIIYCLPPFDEVKANLEREDNSGGKVLEHAEQIYLNYVAFAAREYNSSIMVWDYTKPDLLRLANLLRWANARTEREMKDAG
jgi:hypothetical protein